MTLKEAIRVSIKKYFDGLEPEALKKESKRRLKYNKSFFDKFGESRGLEAYGSSKEK